ncbi:unnamed protein product, partial [Rotaria magnacalcarata]
KVFHKHKNDFVTRVHLHHSTHKSLQLILNYLYTNNIILTIYSIDDILTCAKELDIRKLADLCIAYLSRINKRTIFRILDIACKHNLSEVYRLAHKYLIQSIDECIQTKEFIDIAYWMLNQILSDVTIEKRQESLVIDRTLQWLSCNHVSNKDLIFELLNKIRWENLSYISLKEILAINYEILHNPIVKQWLIKKLKPIRSIEYYDPKTNVWKLAKRLRSGRLDCAVVSFDNKNFLVGGYDDTKSTLSYPIAYDSERKIIYMMIASDKQYHEDYSTSCKCLPTLIPNDQLRELNLSNLQLANIDSFPFEKFPNLHSLDLSYNQLTSINPDWSKLSQNCIKYLNLSRNKLESLLFLKDFKYLNTLNITDNLLRNNERFLSLYICPTLEHLIDVDREQIHSDRLKFDQLLLLLIQANMDSLWSLSRHDRNKKNSKKSLDDFRRSIIKLIEKENIFFEFHLSSLGNYFIEKKMNEFDARVKSTFKTYLSDDFNRSMNIEEKLKSSFEPIKCFRCHHKSNDDLTTISVSMCAFEPNNTSNHILATCGGNKVCFIDCKTCEITHLFEVNTLQSTATSTNRMIKDKNRKSNAEHFSCLCWIEIENINETLNVLAVGSTSGHIYLLSPQWKIMFGHIELSVSSISCLTWHSSNPCMLAIGYDHIVRFINIRSYIDRLQSFIRKQKKPAAQFDYVDSSVFINKIPTTHMYNLYSGQGPLVNITDLLFYPLSKDNIVLLVGTTSGLFIIKYKEKQQQSPIQLAFPKSIWAASEHVESFRIINNSTHLIAMNILGLDQICCFNLEQSLKDQQLHIIILISNPSRHMPTKITLLPVNKRKNSSATESFECIVGHNDGSFFNHEIQTYKTKESILKTKQYKIKCEQNEISNILSTSLNEHYLCLTTNNNLICLYKRRQ